MKPRILHMMLALLLAMQIAPAVARDGNTLDWIEIEAAPVETYPEDLLAKTDFDAIESRVNEARISGAPLAVRIIDMTQDTSDLPFPIRKYARDDFSQPFSAERQEAIVDSWVDNEAIETEPGADDGFLLLILVPEDRTQTQAIWRIGDNALPLNGLTEQNIQLTHGVMNEQFADANMPNGVYLGLSEFSYYVQFGEPKRIERSKLDDALHSAVYVLAGATATAGIAVPVLAWWLARRNNYKEPLEQSLSPWHAAALHLRRATPDVTAAMLLEAVHSGEISPGKDGSLKIETDHGSDVVEQLRQFATPEGIVPQDAMLEVEAILAPIRTRIENELATTHAMTDRVLVDRTWMQIAMGAASLLAIMSAVPTVIGMSALGVYAIGIVIVGIFVGWWWLAHRSYTSPAGEALLNSWLEGATANERQLFDTAVNLELFTDRAGGPAMNPQTRLVRQLRGLSAG